MGRALLLPMLLALLLMLSAGAGQCAPQPSQLAALKALEAESGASWQVRWDEATGVPALLSGRSVRLAAPWGEAAREFVGRHQGVFRMGDAARELRLLREDQDGMGMQHVRFEQRYKGIRVYGGELLVHLSGEGEVTCVNGRYWPEIKVRVSPRLSAASALAVAKSNTEGSDYLREPPETELVVFPGEEGYRLAWRVLLFVEPASGPARWEYIVDAGTGAVLQAFDTIKYQATQGSGTGVLGDTKSPLEMFLWIGKYFLVDVTRNVWTHTANYGSALPGQVVRDTDTFFTDGAAVDAHYYMGVVYDYYTTVHGLNIPHTLRIRSTVHYQSNYNNAFWDGTQIVYGDGDGIVFAPLSGELDVVAHETTHGVDQHGPNLDYWFQSGALSESYADVMACFIDTDNWLVGEDVYTPLTPGDALRSLEDPTLYGQPDHMDDYQNLPWWNDNGGVHTNSGIPNKAGYLLSEGGTHPYSEVTVAGIGREKTRAIWFRTFWHYLFSTAQLQDAADLTVTSAIDLYGDGAEAQSARDAWSAVGVAPSAAVR